LPKLALTLLNYRETMQWKKRIYKKRFAFITDILGKSSSTFQKVLRGFLWTFVIILIMSIFSGGMGLYYLYQEKNRFEKTKGTIDQLFDGLNHSTTLSATDQLLVYKQQADYLRNSYKIDEKENRIFGYNFTIRSGNVEGWLSTGRYYDYALLQYRLGYPEDFQLGIKESIKKNTLYNDNQVSPEDLKAEMKENIKNNILHNDNKVSTEEWVNNLERLFEPGIQQGPETMILAAYEMGTSDDCRKLIEIYKHTLEENKEKPFSLSDALILRTAVQVGLFDLVKTTIEQRGNQEFNDIIVCSEAHALLMTGERDKAFALYRKLMNVPSNDWRNEIKKDFAIFRWSGFDDTAIVMAETALQLGKINVQTRPEDESNKSLTTPYIGKWQFEANNQRTQWEIKADDLPLNRHVFQSKRGNTDWVDEDIAVTRFRIKQINNKTIIEEYNARTNTLSLSEVAKISDNEIKISPIDNGNGKSLNEVRIYNKN